MIKHGASISQGAGIIYRHAYPYCAGVSLCMTLKKAIDLLGLIWIGRLTLSLCVTERLKEIPRYQLKAVSLFLATNKFNGS